MAPEQGCVARGDHLVLFVVLFVGSDQKVWRPNLRADRIWERDAHLRLVCVVLFVGSDQRVWRPNLGTDWPGWWPRFCIADQPGWRPNLGTDWPGWWPRFCIADQPGIVCGLFVVNWNRPVWGGQTMAVGVGSSAGMHLQGHMVRGRAKSYTHLLG